MAEAQQPSRLVSGRWHIEPAVGIWRQHDRGPATNNGIGHFIGVGVSWRNAAATQLTASVGYYQLGAAIELQTTAQGQPRTEVYDSELVPVSAGLAQDFWRGDVAALNVGVELGAVWVRDYLAQSTGPEPLAGTPRDDWTPSFLIAPLLGARRTLAPRLELTATGRLLLGFGDLSPTTIPTFAVGLAFQF